MSFSTAGRVAFTLAVAVFLGSVPALADTIDDVPPSFGLVSPETFRVNDLVTITVPVSDNGTLGVCHLLVDQADRGLMHVSAGTAMLAQVFMTPATRSLQVRCEDAAGNVGLSSVTAIRADVPAVTTPGTIPVGFSAGMLVRLSCEPGETNDEHCQSVYQVGPDGMRHGFQSDDAYRSWYPDGGSVMSISLSAIASLPLGQTILIKPGSSAIRFLSQPACYGLTPPTHLQKFTSDAAAAAVLGSTWKSHIVVLTDAFYQNFTFGSPLDDPHTISDLLN